MDRILKELSWKDQYNYCSEETSNEWPCDMNVGGIIAPGIATSAVALAMSLYLWFAQQKFDKGNEKMTMLSDEIKKGSKAFLTEEYKYLSYFVFIMAIALLITFTFNTKRVDDTDGIRVAACFIAGAILSATAGWCGMIVATDANARTTQAASANGEGQNGLNDALRIAFAGGSVMGFTVVGLGLFGVCLFLYIMTTGRGSDPNDPLYNDEATEYNRAAANMSAFGFGASSIALFARVAGGIYTKAADVGADLVGKVEAGIPEDDPRNPATIADNVGDNVGDVAGMGADLFESFVGSIIAAVTLAKGDVALISLPIWISAIGILASFIGFWFVKTEKDATQKDLLHALHKAIYVAGFLVLAASGVLCYGLFHDRIDHGMRYYGCIVIGLFAGVCIGEITEYFTSYSYKPVQSITDAGKTGPATVIIQGLGVGMISTAFPVLVIVAAVFATSALAGQYGVSVAAVGMLSTLAVTLATDAYGPIADNAGGIAEMSELPEHVRDTTDALDALGNTTAATGKGFAIGSAVLTSISLLSAFREQAALTTIDLADPVVFAGLLFGAMLPFLFAAFTMLSVRKAAGSIIEEVRRQFHEIPGLMEGTTPAEHEKCVRICTACSVEEMILPGSYAVLAPLFIGFLIGPACLAGMLGGAIASGAMLAIMMSNAGGAWDNSKKYIEIEGMCGGKGTETHKACVVGDTVGDPFKDTSGPALNILIKLMSVIALTIAPLISGNDNWENFYFGIIPLFIGIFVSYYYYANYEETENKDYSKAPTTAV